jgi:hypothetical protein
MGKRVYREARAKTSGALTHEAQIPPGMWYKPVAYNVLKRSVTVFSTPFCLSLT